jgi:hypothetical protein
VKKPDAPVRARNRGERGRGEGTEGEFAEMQRDPLTRGQVTSSGLQTAGGGEWEKRPTPDRLSRDRGLE